MSAFFKIGTSVVAGLMLAALAGSARASYPESQSSAESAQMKADAARTRAAELAAQGGWAYKTGAVDRANSEAARYQAEADAASGAVTAGELAVSPELAAAQARLEELRQAGGWAYKSGAVARAEADVRDLAGPHEVMTSQNEAVPSHNWGKPVEQTMHAYR